MALGATLTLVERKNCYTLIGLSQNKEAQEVTLEPLEALVGQREKVETMTSENGKEFALHELLADVLDTKAYFAYFYHSWKRGFHENTNGLFRQDFPKGSIFDHLTMEGVRRIERHMIPTI